MRLQFNKCVEAGAPTVTTVARAVGRHEGSERDADDPGRLAGRLLSPSKEALMHSVAIIARLKTGAEQQATELLAQGPPFDPDEIGLQRHVAYVCGDEVVFVFEGPEVEGVVDDLVGYPFGSRIRAAFDKWRPLIEELPRVARPAYEWEREAK